MKSQFKQTSKLINDEINHVLKDIDEQKIDQLIDDVLDYNSSENELGKNIGNDLSQGNATLPLLYAMWNGDKNQAEVIHDSIINGDLKNIELIKDAINSTGAISYTAKIAYQESERAINALNQLPSSKYLDALYALAKFSVQRHN